MPSVPVTLKVTNATDNSPVAGARVFIDGAANFDPNQFTVTTNAVGNANFQVPSNLSNRVMQVTADGFQSANQLINTIALTPQSVAVSLTPVPVQSQPIDLHFIPEVAGILWSITGPVSANGVTDADGDSSSDSGIPFGNYILTANLTGYQTLTVNPFVVNGQTDPYTFGLIANASPSTIQTGNTSDSSSKTTNQDSSKLSQVITEPPAQNEYIYPNSDFDKYFTITGARIYIGNLFIDECSSIQFALQDNATPVFGYASRFYDAIGQGRSLVQGQLALNFVTEGYLYTVLQEYKRVLKSTQGTPLIQSPKIDTIAQILGLMGARDNLNQQARNNPGDTTSEIRAGQLQAKISALLNTLTPDQVESLSNKRTQQIKAFNDVIGFDNAVYQDVLFDIRVEFGNEVTGVKRVRYLEKCKLISNEQVIAPDGQTIVDSYGFIARRLR